MQSVKSLISNFKKLRYKYLIENIDRRGKNIIYVDTRHLDYWWGIYGIAEKTGWEDIVMYIKKGNSFKKIGWICVCTKAYLKSGLEDLEKDTEEMDFVKKVKEFLPHNYIKYHYYYDNPGDKDFYEVPFEAKRNEMNVKPSSIEMWYPSNGIDKAIVDDCVENFLGKFLNITVERIEYKDIVSTEEAIKEYVKEMEVWGKSKEISFSDELIHLLEDEWETPKGKVLQMLNG